MPERKNPDGTISIICNVPIEKNPDTGRVYGVKPKVVKVVGTSEPPTFDERLPLGFESEKESEAELRRRVAACAQSGWRRGSIADSVPKGDRD